MRLSAISSDSHMFSLLGFDQLRSLARAMEWSTSDPQDLIKLEELIHLMMEVYSPHVTGVILSPEVGYHSINKKAETAGPLFCLERRLIEPDPFTIPLLMNNWNVEVVRQNYGVAKLELFYNPTEKEALTKRQMVAELYDFCIHQGIDFLLELIVSRDLSTQLDPSQFQQLQLEAIQDVRKYCSLIALEYPLDALGAVTVTAELDVPWIISARETPYEQFKEQLRTALDSGAKGFLAATQWLPVHTQQQKLSPEEIQKFVFTTGRDRVIELNRIVAESA